MSLKTQILTNLTKIKKFSIANSPTILTVTAIAGVGITAYLSGKSAITASALYDYYNMDDTKEKKEYTIECCKIFAPAVISGIATCGCIIGAHHIDTKRRLAATSAYILSEKMYSDYRDKVEQKIGRDESRVIEQQVMENHKKEADYVAHDTPFLINGRKQRIYEEMSGRYFYASVDEVVAAINKFNYRLLNETYLSLNDFYITLDLPEIEMGSKCGWDVNDGYIQPSFSAHLDENSDACLRMSLDLPPRPFPE